MQRMPSGFALEILESLTCREQGYLDRVKRRAMAWNDNSRSKGLDDVQCGTNLRECRVAIELREDDPEPSFPQCIS